MCGIVGYIGDKNAYEIVINGLRRLEYRGYDSSGIALYNSELNVCKTKGKVEKLVKKAKKRIPLKATIGIGHTRWATHGEPNDTNAHPLISNNGSLVIVHNGIIENYATIKNELISKGYKFKSETDTEVLVNLIEYVQVTENVKLGKAVQLALSQVVGAYAIAVFDKKKPDEIVVARLGSPLAIGIGEGEMFIGSDVTPFLDFTRKVIYLEEGQVGVLRNHKETKFYEIAGDSIISPTIETLELELSEIEKGGYDHFMLKEIHEQPKAIIDTLRGRLKLNKGIIKLSGIDNNLKKFTSANKITIIGCGTSWHAGLVGEYIFEKISRISVEVEYASEFRYRDPIINTNDIVIAISQSGETADTLAAMKLAKEKGAFVFGICNVVGSSITRESHSGTYTHAGPEIGVASTKAFTTQISVLYLMALKIGKEKGIISSTLFNNYLAELKLIPEKIEKALSYNSKVEEIAEQIKGSTNCLYLGRGFNFPVALEGALKLKEISYIHAEGYPAAEMKHGPIALIDENMPTIVIATAKGHYDKVVSNIREIQSRKGKIIAIITEGDKDVKEIADYYIEVPETIQSLTPLLTTIPLQLLSYHIAVKLRKNVDQPRNLAKSVTVE